MHIINLTPLEPGVYNDHKADHITAPPEGWAMIPENFPLPPTFPRCGTVEAEGKTYPYDVEVEKKVTKTREVASTDESGNPTTITEEYEETVMETEQREKVILTVTRMTEGTLPEVTETEPELTMEERITALEEYQAETLYELSLMQLGITG